MYIVEEPLDEKEILSATDEEADAEAITQSIETDGDYCVDHLCGCT